MLRTLSRAAGMALSLVTVLGTADADIPYWDQCWPNCQQWLEDQQCKAWFGQMYYYCGWSEGWTYCCCVPGNGC